MDNKFPLLHALYSLRWSIFLLSQCCSFLNVRAMNYNFSRKKREGVADGVATIDKDVIHESGWKRGRCKNILFCESQKKRLRR